MYYVIEELWSDFRTAQISNQKILEHKLVRGQAPYKKLAHLQASQEYI